MCPSLFNTKKERLKLINQENKCQVKRHRELLITIAARLTRDRGGQADEQKYPDHLLPVRGETVLLEEEDTGQICVDVF